MKLEIGKIEREMNRDRTLDVMKGIGIVAVIVGHLSPYGTKFIFSFHMPLFFFIAGFLYKGECGVNYVKKDIKRLILPYLVTCSVIIIIYLVSFLANGSDRFYYYLKASLWGSGSTGHLSPLFGDYPRIGAIWFLLALFWCKFFFSIIQSFLNNKLIIVLSCILISIAACLIDMYVINLPLAILPGCAALVFYVAGYMFRQMDIFTYIINSKNKIIWTIGLLALWICAIYFPERHLSLVRCDYPIYPLSVIGGIAATATIYICFKMVIHMKLKIFDMLAWLGEVSLVFLCLHLIDLDIPLRWFLDINNGIASIVFDLTFCTLGTIFLTQFEFSREVFGIRRSLKFTYHEKI